MIAIEKMVVRYVAVGDRFTRAPGVNTHYPMIEFFDRTDRGRHLATIPAAVFWLPDAREGIDFDDRVPGLGIDAHGVQRVQELIMKIGGAHAIVC